MDRDDLDRTNLVNKGFIVGLSVKIFLQDVAGSPEQARLLQLACSGSQSQRVAWVILPACGASHIIMQPISKKNTTAASTEWHREFFFLVLHPNRDQDMVS